MALDFTGYDIPAHTQGALERYVEHGLAPGGFLKAVITNDLICAVMKADELNIVAIPEIVKFLYNRVPASCWSTDDNYYNWLDYKGKEREDQ